jgi:predicted alpha-1,2-mannosidase
LPHGSAQPGPNTDTGRSCGYDPTRPIRGFAQIHVCGTGGPGKYGNFLLSPQLGLALGEADHDSSKEDEIATPAYYAVTLTRYGIRIELTVTHCCAIYRITFPQSQESHLDLDLGHNIPGDVLRRAGWPVGGEVVWEDAGRRLRGSMRYHGGWGPEQYDVHCVCEISQAPEAFGTWKDGQAGSGSSLTAQAPRERIGAWWRRPTRQGEQILVKFGVSVQSQERAAQHLARELPGWDFDAVRASAEAQWERALNVVRVTGVEPAQEAYFFVALRNSMLMPRDRRMDHPVQAGTVYYDEYYCAWDVFRSVMPLMTLVRPDMVRECLNSFVERRRRGDQVSDAFINGKELILSPSAEPGLGPWKSGMGGEMVDVIIADASAKGLTGVDWPALLTVLTHHAEAGRCHLYREQDRGWIPCDLAQTSTIQRTHAPSSNTLEMNFTDWCAAQVAERLGHTALAERYRRRSRQWRQVFNPAMKLDGFTGFMSARASDGTWRDELAVVDSRAFAEETTWEYTHFVPHEFSALIEACGGPQDWVRRIEHTLGTLKIRLDNEPTFLLIHTLCLVGRPDLAGYWTRRFMREWYEPDAYPGPDDSGAMASWYVFGCMGIFPNAGQDQYLLHGSLFPEIAIRLENGRDLVLRNPTAGTGRDYLHGARWNGVELTSGMIPHTTLAQGGVLEFTMGNEPRAWGDLA